MCIRDRRATSYELEQGGAARLTGRPFCVIDYGLLTQQDSVFDELLLDVRPLIFQDAPLCVVDPGEADLDLVTEDALVGEAEAFCDPIRPLVPGGDPKHDLVVSEIIEPDLHRSCRRFGAESLAGEI